MPKKQHERVTKIERLTAAMLPELYKNRFNYGMGGTSLKDFVALVVDVAKEIVRKAKT